ncbi:MAG TPA: type VI secretion system ImpA family N-terminal domain-containing protein, partial [Isosphaeraceae bacterium]|nr:type VI secretion system ImpA family N-terminal domain-containing protein [Isosphaeraceae bacterium]
MPSPQVLDFPRLLAQIPGDKPTGVDLRQDTSPTSDYYAIRDARKRASDNERRIDKGDDNAEPADWRPVVERATGVLAEKTKDLELAAYLIEALVRTKGFAGLRDGYRLARELVERFWEGLYPTAQDSEVQDRFSHILHLNGLEGPGALIVPVRKIAMTAATSVGTFNLTHLQQARSLSQIADAKVRQKRIDEGAITLEMIQTAVSETPSQFYADLVQDLNQA